MTTLVQLAAFIAWLCGTVLAAGWWKLAAFCFPPYAWYRQVNRARHASAKKGRGT